MAFGLVLLLQVSAADFERVLKDAGTRGATNARRVRGALVAGEVALAVVLVVGAALMVRTVLNLMNVDAGFERSRLVTFGVALPAATYSTFARQVQVCDSRSKPAGGTRSPTPSAVSSARQHRSEEMTFRGKHALDGLDQDIRDHIERET